MIYPQQIKEKDSDLKFLITRIETEVMNQNLFISNPTIEQANNIFSKIESCIKIPKTSLKGRVRRFSQLQWTTAVFIFRKKNRR